MRIFHRLGASLAAAALLTGCTPFVGYQHLSDPGIESDGYDLACVGAKYRSGRLMTKGAWCENVRGGGMVSAAIEYDLIE